MTPLVVIPIRSFAGMERLAPKMDDRARAVLSRMLADRVLDAALRTECEVAVVTGDPTVVAWAAAQDVIVVPDPGTGLNGAAAAGVAAAGDRPWAVLHGDLPLITPADVDALFAAALPAIAPSKDGGTSAIAALGAFVFRYGVGSYHRHLAAVRGAARVVVRPGLAVDIDRVEDLVALGTRWLDRAPAMRDTAGL